MSEPRVDDDIAMGYAEVCERCDVGLRFCLCQDYDRLEDIEQL
jgi:DTW domain-containing protein YfiP